MAKSLSMATGSIWVSNADPGVSETSVEQGNFWLNTVTGAVFQLNDPTVGLQSWYRYPSSGASSLTNHGLLKATGVSSYDSLSVGSTGTVLAGSTGNDPSFTATPSVTSITLNGGTALGAYLEQQSWTPTIIGSSSAGTGTYTLQAGYYTRIGNMIFAACEITWTNHDGTGDLWIGNLPFTVRNSSNYSPEGIINTQNMTLPGGANRTSIGSAVAGTTHLIVVVPINNASNSPVQMQVSGNIHATIAYLT